MSDLERLLQGVGEEVLVEWTAALGSAPSCGASELPASATERLALAAFVDPLTGLRNRRGLDRDLAQRLALAKRGGRPLTVVVGDLDGLKAINDRDGHAAGDIALRALGVALDSALRAGDTAYRIGGDEFLLLLADTDAAEAEAMVARVKATAPAFSCGQATFPADGEEGACLMELADQRLLSGRRQVRMQPGDQSRQSRRTGRSRSGTGALTVAALTVTALLGGVGVGFAAENVMGARESVTKAVVSPAAPTGGPEPAGKSHDAVVESVASATEVAVDAPMPAPTSADQVETAATIESTPVDDVTGLTGLTGLPSPDPTTVVEVVEGTVVEATEEPQLADEPQKGPGAEAGEGKSGGGPKQAR